MKEVAVRKTESVWDQIQKMEQQIMRRAYEIFNSNGVGQDLENWLAAEREMIWKPAIELSEKDNQFLLRIVVAGVDPKDLRVEVTADELLVRAESQTRKKEKKGEIHTSEFQSGSLFRLVRFPKKVNPDQVKAEVKNGLLEITVPVAVEAPAAAEAQTKKKRKAAAV